LSIDLTAVTAACVDRVRLFDHVSFPELRRVLEHHGVPASGEHSMELSKCPNMLLWAGMSEEFYTIAGALYDHEHIEVRPTILLTYLADGGMLRLPIAHRPPKRGYRKPHWVPVVFCWTGPRGDRQAELAATREAMLTAAAEAES
jgi:hypothetical protein